MTLLIGTSTVGTANVTVGLLCACKFTCAASGVVSGIKVYSLVNGDVKVGIYSNVANSPGTLLTSNNTGTACTAGTWTNVAVPDRLVTAGTGYWLCAVGSVTGTMSRSTGTYTTKYKSGVYAGGVTDRKSTRLNS